MGRGKNSGSGYGGAGSRLKSSGRRSSGGMIRQLVKPKPKKKKT